MKKCKLVQNIMNFKFCYIIFCTIICFIVLSVPASAKENSDNVIRVGSFEETYNVVNEKGERSGYGIRKFIVKVVPIPNSLSTSMVPLCASTIAFAKGNPSPIPCLSLEKRLR